MINNKESQVGLNKVKMARDILLQESPFYASIILCLKITPSNSIDTFCINSTELKFNPAFANSLTIKNIKIILRHELLHLIFKHHLRGSVIPNYSHSVWNIAGDLAINSSLWYEDGFPESGIVPGCDGFKTFPMNLSAEEYYKMLCQKKDDEEKNEQTSPADSSDQNDPSDDGSSDESNPSSNEGDDAQSDSRDSRDESSSEFDGGEYSQTAFGCFEACDEANIEAEEEHISKMVYQAIATAEESNETLPSIIKRNIDEILPRPVVPWKALLRNCLSMSKTSGVNWSNPSRRNTSSFIMPSRKVKQKGNVLFAVDISGSINKNIYRNIASEIISSMSHMDEIDMWFWDTEIKGEHTLNAHTKLDDIVVPDGGCTRVSCVFDRLKVMREFNPNLIIIFTDMYFQESPETVVKMVRENRANVLWINFGRYPRNAPIGRIINICEQHDYAKA
jgi:predicted metal-dependent peptidase